MGFPDLEQIQKEVEKRKLKKINKLEELQRDDIVSLRYKDPSFDCPPHQTNRFDRHFYVLINQNEPDSQTLEVAYVLRNGFKGKKAIMFRQIFHYSSLSVKKGEVIVNQGLDIRDPLEGDSYDPDTQTIWKRLKDAYIDY